MAGTSDERTGKSPSSSGWSRRNFLKGVGAAAVATDVVMDRMTQAAPPPGAESVNEVLSGPLKISLMVNDKAREVTVEPRTTLLSALRDRLEPPVTGPKLVCNAGTCGACTVMLNGKTVYGCSILAVDAVGKKITTVEGLGTPDHMSPVQAAFVEKDAMMCGYCTSGFVTSATALLRKNPNPTEQQIREGCKGNFCRCGTFPRIFEAVAAAAKTGGVK